MTRELDVAGDLSPAGFDAGAGEMPAPAMEVVKLNLVGGSFDDNQDLAIATAVGLLDPFQRPGGLVVGLGLGWKPAVESWSFRASEFYLFASQLAAGADDGAGDERDDKLAQAVTIG